MGQHNISFVVDTHKEVADVQSNYTSGGEINDAGGLLPLHGGGSHCSRGTRGYSWLEGCTLNPRSGVQTPEVPECSSVVGGWGPTCPIRVHLGVDNPGSGT
jgi:hypothetical protein